MINDPLAQAFGEVLRSLRGERDLSQEKLALEAGLDRTYVSMLERGVRQPTLTTVFLLSRAFRVSMANMIESTESAYSAMPRRVLRAAESAMDEILERKQK